jgi:hypothetical protein
MISHKIRDICTRLLLFSILRVSLNKESVSKKRSLKTDASISKTNNIIDRYLERVSRRWIFTRQRTYDLRRCIALQGQAL